MVDKVTVEKTYAIPCQYHSTKAPYTAIHLLPMPVTLAFDCLIQLDFWRKISKGYAV
jgi:hypothetical protein